MSLIEALAGRTETGDNHPLISGHDFQGVLVLWFTGEINATQAKTLIEADSDYALTSADEAWAQEFKTVYDALPNVAQRTEYMFKLDACVMLLSAAKLTFAQFRTIMGVT